MNKRLKVILIVFGLTPLLVIAYIIYFIKTQPEQDYIGLLVLPFIIAGWLYFIECLIFAIVYIKHLKKVWFLLLPVFLISSIVPIYTLYFWIDSLPIAIPKPGKLPVSMQEYNRDKKLILYDFKSRDNYYKNTTDTIISVDIDTVIYSPDKSKFFSVIMVVVSKGAKKEYGSEYRTGLRKDTTWDLVQPENTMMEYGNTISEFKYNIRQYYYKHYSINGSSKKREIWIDSFMFYPDYDRLKEAKEEKERNDADSIIGYTTFIPAYDLQIKNDPHEFSKYTLMDDRIVLIYSKDHSQFLNPIMITNSRGENFLHYYFAFKGSNNIYEWTYFPPKMLDSTNKFYSEDVLKQINQITKWDFSHTTLDDKNFWNDYVLEKSGKDYKYLELIK